MILVFMVTSSLEVVAYLAEVEVAETAVAVGATGVTETVKGQVAEIEVEIEAVVEVWARVAML